MNLPVVFWLIPLASVCALMMAWLFFQNMMKEDEGSPRMKEIALYIRRGAMAYLRQQYRVVLIVFIVLAIIFAIMAYGFNAQNPWVPFAFLTGGFFSGLAGFFGMKTATYASGRTANAAREGLHKGLKIAFRSGAVMGLVVVGLGLLDIAVWFLILNCFYSDMHSSHVSAAAYTPRRLMSALIWSEKSRLTFPKTTRATRPPLPTMSVTTSVTWPAWAPTSTRAIAAAFSPRQLLAPRPLP